MSQQFEIFPPHRRLFAAAAIRERLRNDHAALPDDEVTVRLNRWKAMLQGERRALLNEESYKAEFLADVFDRLLGYTVPGGGDAYHMRREVHGPSDARPADAVLGILGIAQDKVRAVIEVKPPGTRLEARSTRTDRLSPVDQGFLYANQCDDVRWIIISNFDEIRLYSRQRGATAYQSFRTAELEGTQLHEFWYLLRRENLIADGDGPSPTQLLAEEAWREQAHISKTFYLEYQDARIKLFDEFRRQNAAISALEILRATQCLLDRVLFILFGAAKGLLPHDALARLREAASPRSFLYTPDALWVGLRRLFTAINVGNTPAGITAYNGGLFAPGLLDELQLAHTDPLQRFVLHRILEWDSFDFDSQIDVEILGHIFENSISDLERLQRELIEQPNAETLSWRNREGIFYTPEWVTTYIIAHTAERLLDENPEIGSEFRIVDPACGSGAFLTRLVPVIRQRLRDVAPAEAAELDRLSLNTNIGFFDDPLLLAPAALYRALRRTVFGVDKSADSVEITKLSLWLQTVVQGHALPSLDGNIRVGNSLVTDSAYAADAFDWSNEFVDANRGKFSAVIGNPPWGADASNYSSGLSRFSTAIGQFDTAFVFVELALSLLREGGILGFILPDSILINEDQLPVRKLIALENTLLEVIKLGEGVFPGVFRGSVIVLVRKGMPQADHAFRTLVINKADRRQITDVATAVDLNVLMVRRGKSSSLARVLANPRLELPVNVGIQDEQLLARIDARKLDWNSVVERGRGIELNADGHIVRCPACFQWGPPPLKRKGLWQPKSCAHCGYTFTIDQALEQAHIVDSQTPSDGTTAPYIDGTDIRRYRIARVRGLDVSREGIAYKHPSLFLS